MLARCLITILWLMVPGISHAFDYEDLVRLINERGLTTLPEVLKQLPDEYLENFTLGFGSRSLHGSSYEFPRVILFGTDARLVITFNGDPAHHKHQELELLQFRDATRKFEMRSVAFADGEVTFSPANPEVCLACHGGDPRPIWSSYEYSELQEGVEHWPGFYGSSHDAPGTNTEERQAYERFRTLAGEHPRYRFLKLNHPESHWYPFGVGPFQHRFRPNNRLGNLLARLNAKRIANGLVRRPFFERYQNLSLTWLLQCPQAEAPEFLAYAKSLYQRTYPSLSHIALPEYDTRSPEQVYFVIEKLMSGLETFTWNLSVTPDPRHPRFFTGIVTIDDLVAAEVLANLPQDHWLREYYVPWSQRDLYDTFKVGYYDANVAPGGVGEAYNELGQFFDRDRARKACPELASRAKLEMSSVSTAG